ncbi:DUF892 family protein [Gluconobacter sphaericus]|uniref:YciE/YciF family protein n=1 Tax=Gluconobacter sphaericus NBRC 12467 TaxID=1307951 RepID=A0AA37WCM7_9PROT|nr:DUF892 family protein [Gluconobacter sphaericus]MBF0886351.1 DUF892 family protein [Gluconobacter sphaericus]MBS1086407.1 DUF892 family protein [Gluconobacter sphaericus]MBS1100629.1 DUF892 family protein [Gluconobacter sphaericus]QQX92045.1 DUF892 family protein [Gluconobacter sphaericus]GBR51987.1 hypothetical protein AA12467_0803 [Gluconobacter sphaericus NBRC 12467]
MGRTKTTDRSALDIYLRALRDHLSIESKAIETALSELPVCERYPGLCRRMEQDLAMGRSHAREVTILLSRHGHPAPVPHETVSSILSTVSGLLHGGEEHDVLKNVLAASGYRAHQIASLQVLIVLAQQLGFAQDAAALDCLKDEEIAAAGALEGLTPEIVAQYLAAG